MDGARRMYTAFEGDRRFVNGSLIEVAVEIKREVDRRESTPFLIFDDETGEQIDVDLRGTVDDVSKRLELSNRTAASETGAAANDDAPRGPGRPKLGVVAREVTLLPRHWEWLGDQPGGASITLRKIVEEARRANQGRDRIRKAQEAAYRFLSAMGGNLPGFEEANRALFAGDAERFEREVAGWPADVRAHAAKLARAAFQPTTG